MFENTDQRPLQRIYFFGFLVFTCLLILLLTMAYRQLFQAKFWTDQMAQSSTRAVRLPAPRGNIIDRYGAVMVDSRPSYNIALYLDEFGAGKDPERLVKTVRRSIETIKDRMKLNTRISNATLRKHYELRRFLPLTVWNDLSPAALAAFEERSPWMKGVDIQIDPVRTYPMGKLGSHILGYVGKPETNQEEEEIDFDSAGRRAFSQPTIIGKTGIEAAMDKELQGTPGYRIIRLNAAGLKEKEIRQEAPTPGNNIVLTIDSDIQSAIEESFAPEQRGACVVIDPNNGDILGMASFPSYDPGLFVPSIKRSDWATLSSDPGKPMRNRAIQGNYNPGSTFKLITALAGLENNSLATSTHVECPGYFNLGEKTFRCWNSGGHGDMNLRSAIAESCNVYFYTAGKNMGGKPLWEMARAFNLGEKTNIPLKGEIPGVLPSDEWKSKNRPHDGKWSTGDAVNMAIGQGYLETTPLQMASVAATFANGGTVYKPRLVLRSETPENEVVMEFPVDQPEMLPASSTNIQIIREDMLAVVEEGTAKSLRSAMLQEDKEITVNLSKMKVAAKTGTAQFTLSGVKQKPRAWIVTFAPYEQPRYAMAIIVEEGDSGGHTAAPIAGAIYRKIFQLEVDRKKPRKPMAIPALAVTEKIEGQEGDVSGQFAEPTANEESPPETIPAEKADVQ